MTPKPEVREVLCKTLLRRMEFGRGELEYTANLYRGCTHGCVYCYAPSLVHDERRWGGASSTRRSTLQPPFGGSSETPRRLQSS